MRKPRSLDSNQVEQIVFITVMLGAINGIQPSYLNHVSLNKLLQESLAKGSRAAADSDASGLESRDLRVSTTFASADDGTGVTHTTAWGSADTSNEADSRLVGLVRALEELSGILLGATTDLADHDDAVGLGVIEEHVQTVDEVGAGEGVTTDTNDEGLAKAGLGRLVHSLIGEGSGTRDDTDATTLVDETGHDTDLTLSLEVCQPAALLSPSYKGAYWGDNARAVRANKSGLVLCLENIRDPNHVWEHG